MGRRLSSVDRVGCGLGSRGWQGGAEEGGLLASLPVLGTRRRQEIEIKCPREDLAVSLRL